MGKYKRFAYFVFESVKKLFYRKQGCFCSAVFCQLRLVKNVLLGSCRVFAPSAGNPQLRAPCDYGVVRQVPRRLKAAYFSHDGYGHGQRQCHQQPRPQKPDSGTFLPADCCRLLCVPILTLTITQTLGVGKKPWKRSAKKSITAVNASGLVDLMKAINHQIHQTSTQSTSNWYIYTYALSFVSGCVGAGVLCLVTTVPTKYQAGGLGLREEKKNVSTRKYIAENSRERLRVCFPTAPVPPVIFLTLFDITILNLRGH